MPCPAQGPEHASQLAFPTTGRLPSTPSAADVVGLVRGFIGSTQPSDSSCLPRWLRSAELPAPTPGLTHEIGEVGQATYNGMFS
jgi:hypothetical protein